MWGDTLSRLQLALLPTPLEKASRLSQVLGGPAILFKREDLTGLALGGNKARKLEFIMADVLQQGCDVVITTAGVQSNMCRTTTAAASKLGLKTVLLLRGTGEEEPQGNLLLDQIFGADIRFIATADPYDPRIVETLEQIGQELVAQGHRPYILHLPGRTGALATAAYIAGAEELMEQCTQADIAPDYLIVAVGSGITMAGLVAGLKYAGSSMQVIGISVQRPAQEMIPRIIAKAQQACDLLGRKMSISPADFLLFDQYIGSGYGVPTVEAVEAIRFVGRSEGILLDPIYTGKAMAGLIDLVRQGKIAPEKTVVFLHSGGAPALFVHHQLMAGNLFQQGS